MSHLLRFHWSPEQITLTLAHLYPLGHEYRVSHKTISTVSIYATPTTSAVHQGQGTQGPGSKKPHLKIGNPMQINGLAVKTVRD